MYSKYLNEHYPLLNNVKLNPALVGFQAGLIPFLGHTSAARVDMYASHSNQALPVEGAEFPQIFAGPEKNLGEYEFSTSRRKQDARLVLAVIPKYPMTLGPSTIKSNPSLTVIYIGDDDSKIDYFTIEAYTTCSNGFGYENVLENTHRVKPGEFIPKDMTLVTSPNHRNGLYCSGINLNVAYMTLEETIEDAMLVSESAAHMMQSTELKKDKIIISANQYPLNTYGDEWDIKFMPDIGECVNASGVLAAFRPVNAETLIPDTMQATINVEQSMHDVIYYAKPGSKIIDITVNASRSTKMPKTLYAQMDKYLDAMTRYWQEIVNVYGQYSKDHAPSQAFSTLVSKAIQRLTVAGESIPLKGVKRRPKTKLIGKNGRAIEFMEVTVTYISPREVKPGFKITGRDRH